MTKRVAIVVSHPIQHFCPLYRALTADGRVCLRVLFGSTAGAQPYFDAGFNRQVTWQPDLLRGFDYEFLPGAASVTGVARSVSNRALKSRLEAFWPDVVVVYGFFHGISRAGIRWARARGSRVLLVSDSELRTRRPGWMRVRKALTVPWLLREIDGFLTVGDNNEAYYLRYGANRRRFFRCPFPIDEVALRAAIAHRDDCRESVRARLGIPAHSLVALTAGKLTSRKATDQAIRAVAHARATSGRLENLYLVIAGDGPAAIELRALADQLIPGFVRMPGFVDVQELPRYYVAADVFLHPSSEDPHPLVVSEAVYTGLPVIVSDRVGSVGASDDVRPGENGLEYRFGDVEGFSRHVVQLGTAADLRMRFGERSLAIGQERTMAHSVNGFMSAVEGVTGSSAGRTLGGIE